MRYQFRRLVPFLSIALMVAVAGCHKQQQNRLPPSTIKPDEDILFYPTYGHYDALTNAWTFDVHGVVFEPENSSAKRAALIAALRASAGIGTDVEADSFLEDRIRPFLVDNERGKSVTIEFDDSQFAAGISQADGHFAASLAIDADTLGTAIDENHDVEIEAVLRDGDARTFAGRVHLIAPSGVSLISDIDDTIKHSLVTDKSELLQNTFIREFQPVEGMADLYQSLADSDVAFHYVSGSPWQLYQPLDHFLSDAGYPKGTFHLKRFRLKDSSGFEILSSQQETKLAAIKPLLAAFPGRVFILVGDSGEQDPEIYGRLAREFPDQIVAVFIRNVTAASRTDERFRRALADVPADRWHLFDEASQITEHVADVVESQSAR